ncbi:HrpE/YscL family type III secretion apparatus protein [Vibrio lentus]|uniref:Type III secretion protein n=1 Tax=Vibrio lentus TaxID=136468 RepID=A0AB36XGS7_9VIBR|nr:HrpE/YscL family type III secretion apparatus protein [Vibrio lentus]MCC4839905.1 hypothetical protein [Vibrio lentus]PMI13263.1 hypothetical protein BCU51_22775 [Vibrio lentus]PMK37639.1 hypothetical protein BCU02_08835 [Vibrio lentus]PMK41936.1 hypothetical protein BCT99_06940 [Vibrio lentus]PML34283.1 hypothetical protein BCT79_10365 [Vibrio lentus]
MSIIVNNIIKIPENAPPFGSIIKYNQLKAIMSFNRLDDIAHKRLMRAKKQASVILEEANVQAKSIIEEVTQAEMTKFLQETDQFLSKMRDEQLSQWELLEKHTIDLITLLLDQLKVVLPLESQLDGLIRQSIETVKNELEVTLICHPNAQEYLTTALCLQAPDTFTHWQVKTSEDLTPSDFTLVSPMGTYKACWEHSVQVLTKALKTEVN